MPITDQERAEAAFLVLLETLFSPLSDRLRLSAAKTLLYYCAPPPLRRKSLTVEDTEKWLSSLIK